LVGRLNNSTAGGEDGKHHERFDRRRVRKLLRKVRATLIDDAKSLADELETKTDAESAFEGFLKRRYERCKTISEGSIQVGEWELSHSAEADHKGMLVKMITLAAEPI
jgi:hypothetical protein